MEPLLLAVIAIIALALLFDFSNGFHDAANSVATVVATRAMGPKAAVAFSAFFNFLAYFFVGTAVANTVSKVVDSEYAGVAVVFAALIGAIAWNYLTWWVGMPSSSSHALIGGLVGAGLSAGVGRRHRLGEGGGDRTGDLRVSSGRVHDRLRRDVSRGRDPTIAPAGPTTRGLSSTCRCCQLLPSRSGTARTTRRRRWGSSLRCWPAPATPPSTPTAPSRAPSGSPSAPTRRSPSERSGEAGRSSRRWDCGSRVCTPAPASRPTSGRPSRSSVPRLSASPSPRRTRQAHRSWGPASRPVGEST